MSCLLIVDDDPEDLQAARAILAALPDIEIETAENGHQAFAVLSRFPADVVITDLHMPELDGLDLLQAVRERYSDLPVIVMTAHGSEETAANALSHGASGYVPKRMLESQLLPIVQKVLAAIAARKDRQRLEKLLEYTETKFVLESECDLTAPIIGYLLEKANRLLLFDENELVRIGLAIDEALNNAIYHGNLEVSSELRERDDGIFHTIASERRNQSPFSGRKVEIICRVSSEEFTCVIRDEGRGFAVEAVPDPLAPENLEKAGGRGLFMIRQFMDEVRHNETANEITMIKRKTSVGR